MLNFSRQVSKFKFFALPLFIFVALGSKPVAAATCSASVYGKVSGSFSAPESGTYKVWVRIRSTTSVPDLQIEIDGSSCYQLRSNSSPTKWNWMTTQTNGVDSLKYLAKGTHSYKVTGQNGSILLDKIILLGVNEKCSSNGATPIDHGVNCNSGTTTINPSDLSNSVIDKNKQVESIKYYIDGKEISAEDLKQIDADTLSDGSHKVESVIQYKDGTTDTAQQIITSDQPDKTDKK